MEIVNHIFGFTLSVGLPFLLIYAHCKAEKVNIFHIFEVINSIETLRKNKEL